MRRQVRIIALIALLILVAGCSKSEKPCLGENCINQADEANQRTGYTPGHFFLHADYDYYEVTNSLGAGKRHFVRATDFANDKIAPIRELDLLIGQYDQPMIITLRSGYGTVGGHGYCAFEEKELNEWIRIVGLLVERYDNDSNFGCSIDNGRDCYAKNDGLYPSELLKIHIKKKPVSYWQVENELLWQLNHCYDGDKAVKYTTPELVEHLKLVSGAIRENGNGVRVVLGGLTGLDIITLLDGFNKAGYVEMGQTDCDYKKVYLSGAAPNQVLAAEYYKKRAIQLLVDGAPYYDVIDFHHYANDPQGMSYNANWIRAILKDNSIEEKEFVSLENAGPFYFFPLMNESQPGLEDCKKTGADPARSFSNKLLSSYVVKNHVIGFSAGVTKIAWSTLGPTLGWSDNFVRTSLVNENKTKKPAFYTYRIMAEKLEDFTKVEKVDAGHYLFYFEEKNPVQVLWSESGVRTVNLGPGRFKVTRIILDEGTPNPEVYILSGQVITVDDVPVFVEQD